MPNDHIKSEISAYLAGGLPEARNREIETHTAACDKCRTALTKARAKQARVKREALKKAGRDPLPNLFLARQGKEAGVDQPSTKSPWGLLVGVILAGVVYGIYRHFSPGARMPETSAVVTDAASVETSSAPVVSSAPAVTPPVAVPEKSVPPAAPPVSLEVKQEWKGTDSGIKTGRVAVIRSEKAWGRLWDDMQVKEPSVDFDEYLVVCIFAGARTPNAAVHFGRIRENDDEVVISYSVTGSAVSVPIAATAVSSFTVSNGTSPVIAPNTAAEATSHPYLLSMLPRTTKKLRVTQREAL